MPLCYKTLNTWGIRRKFANFAKIREKEVDILLTILGIAALMLGLFLCLRPYVPSVLASYGGLWLLQWGGMIDVPTVTLSFWGVMVVLVVMTNSMLSPTLVKATQGLPHILVTSAAGMLLGMTLGYYASMVVGAVVGAAAGAVFFARTPKGKGLQFPSQRFLQYLCAKGFPTVVSVVLTGIAIMVAIAAYNSMPHF